MGIYNHGCSNLNPQLHPPKGRKVWSQEQPGEAPAIDGHWITQEMWDGFPKSPVSSWIITIESSWIILVPHKFVGGKLTMSGFRNNLFFKKTGGHLTGVLESRRPQLVEAAGRIAMQAGWALELGIWDVYKANWFSFYYHSNRSTIVKGSKGSLYILPCYGAFGSPCKDCDCNEWRCNEWSCRFWGKSRTKVWFFITATKPGRTRLRWSWRSLERDSVAHPTPELVISFTFWQQSPPTSHVLVSLVIGSYWMSLLLGVSLAM